MFEEKPDPQIFEEEKSKEKKPTAKELLEKIENLKERIEMKVEIYEESDEKENKIIKINEGLLNEIAICAFVAGVEGLEEGEKLLLYLEKGDLYFTALKGEYPHAWQVKNEEIITEIKRLISVKEKKNSEE